MDISSDEDQRLSPFARAIALVSSGIGALGLATLLIPHEVIRGRLDAAAFDGSAEPYTPELHTRLQIAAAVLGTLFLAAGITCFVTRGRWIAITRPTFLKLKSDARVAGRQLFEFIRSEWILLGVVAVVALGMRLPWIDQPIRYDEATSWLDYASQPLFVTVSKYDTPNNHVFHNLCMGLAIRCFGSTLFAIRLTALAAGVLTCVLTAGLAFAHCLSSSGDRGVARFCGLLAGLLVAVSSFMIEYSTLGRGYTLIACLFLLCWMTAREAALSRNLFLVAVCVLSAAVGLWTIPVMLYSLVMATILLLWDPAIRNPSTTENTVGGIETANVTGAITRKALHRGLIVGWLAVIGLTALLYLPVLLVGGVQSLAGNTYVTPIGIGHWFATWSGVAYRGQFLVWRGISVPIRCLWIFGIAGLVTRPDNWRSRLILLAVLVVPVGMMPMLQRVHPPSRVWLFLVSVLAILSAWGWSGRIRALKSRKWAVILKVSVVAAMVVWPALTNLITDPITFSEETGQAHQAREAVEFLKRELQLNEPIVAVCPASAPIRYYATREGIDWIHFDWPSSPRTRDDMAIVVVSQEGGYDQSVADVLSALNLDEAFRDWTPTEIWSQPGLTLYRLNRP